MIPFYSKRNQVYPVLREGRISVEKHFLSPEDWLKETEMYSALSGRLPVPEVLESRPGFLALEYMPYLTMLDLLEKQEKEDFKPEPWEALASWLKRCYSLCGMLPGEGNLRNFLWDEENRQITGLDFENYSPCTPDSFGAVMIASVLEYNPAGTPVKKQAARLLAEQWNVPDSAIATERRSLQYRRKKKHQLPMSGIVLAGGFSSRMGRDKSKVPLLGRTLLQWQVDKLRMLGIEDIMLSGENCTPLLGTRVIPDEIPHRGPLGGLHACLRTAENPRCMVLGVDVPLVPVVALAHLYRTHSKGITVLRHGKKQEPLIGIYDSDLADIISPLIQEHGASVRALSEMTTWKCFDYLGPEIFLKNCNTPKDISEVREIAMEYSGKISPTYIFA